MINLCTDLFLHITLSGKVSMSGSSIEALPLLTFVESNGVGTHFGQPLEALCPLRCLLL